MLYVDRKRLWTGCVSLLRMRTAADVRREKDAERAAMSAADVRRSLARKRAEQKARVKAERAAIAMFNRQAEKLARKERAQPLDGEPNAVNTQAWQYAKRAG